MISKDANPSVLMRSYDRARTGATTNETLLTPAAVRDRGIRRLFSLGMPGDARGCEAQPLIVSGVRLKDGSVRNVVYLATMANDVFAYDAENGSLLWKVNLGTPVKGSRMIDAWGINDNWGILSTPVIDEEAGLLYACAWISENRTVERAQHFLHAVSLQDAKQMRPPLNLEGALFDPGHGLARQQFRSAQRKQRAALLLLNGAVFIGFGTILETSETARGWLIAVDTATWSIAATWCSTARGSGGGIWMSGAGPAADAAGNIYIVSGNGDFDAVTDFGESIVKLRYVRPAAGAAGSLRAIDWWTPWTDDGRTGGNPEGESANEKPKPSNFRMVPHLARMGIMTDDMGGAWGDQDFGAGGPVLAEEAGALLAAGKDGILYTAALGNLGRTQPADLTRERTAGNYRKLKAPPLLYTYYDPSIEPAAADPMAFNRLAANRTHHLHGTPVLWRSAIHGLMHFCGGENGNLRAWSIAESGVSTYLACSAEVASAQSPVPPGGMPGWMISLSANGERDGIVWALIPYTDANMQLSAGRFLAYDAQDFASVAGGGAQIVPIWDSQDWGRGCAFTHPKFNRPVVCQGRIYVPTYDSRVDVYSLP